MSGILDAIARFIASNEPTAAAAFVAIAAFVLYGVLGRRYLGADDDFWTPVRRRVLPKLDELGTGAGLYAESQRNTWREYAGTAYVDDVDTFERHLEAMGYLRNPVAAYKYAPVGWKSNGSWARRFGYMDGAGRRLMGAFQGIRIPGPNWATTVLGRLLVGLSDILALRQRHLFFFARPAKDSIDADMAIHVFAHDEPNSVNPLTAWAHYRGGVDGQPGGDWDADSGVSGFQADVDAYGPSFPWEQADPEQDGAEPA